MHFPCRKVCQVWSTIHSETIGYIAAGSGVGDEWPNCQVGSGDLGKARKCQVKSSLPSTKLSSAWQQLPWWYLNGTRPGSTLSIEGPEGQSSLAGHWANKDESGWPWLGIMDRVEQTLTVSGDHHSCGKAVQKGQKGTERLPSPQHRP